MDRLTQRDEYGFVDLLKENGQVFKEFEQHANNDVLLDRLYEALYKLADYEDLEEQERLIKLPCKPQSKLYTLKDHCKITADTFCRKDRSKCGHRDYIIESIYLSEYQVVQKLKDFGETIFINEKDVLSKKEKLQNLGSNK